MTTKALWMYPRSADLFSPVSCRTSLSLLVAAGFASFCEAGEFTCRGPLDTDRVSETTHRGAWKYHKPTVTDGCDCVLSSREAPRSFTKQLTACTGFLSYSPVFVVRILMVSPFPIKYQALSSPLHSE